MSNQLLSGWIAFRDLNDTDKALFKSTVHLLGVTYSPLFVATQVVSGTNYSFLTKGTVTSPEAPLRIVKIHVYKPLSSEAHITKIEEVLPQ
ncbi:conserved hypothetical protein [Pectobacterium atrosepticum SCRI1043]|uniref:Uncharacterized protein n=1 Tax=Pectobacterium atrosepticum (strain SCRI 1043 / ATCC BAA-672) TaxID=218491 RepID=Q6D5P3_PECAS|nr:hypothetical protein [Pectobacterium atrosepticum]GKV83902.1 hypothetical protein PEC301296_02140 [Pectobacterium carotovorum subsp. carotovorum]AIA70833.1 hypothetical protein EV46_09615 [Pectobacterium atrosepticum]AIK14394.1 hypothetical protein GZ59_25990 [Pectobacterium atrosepticum]ATY91146.1 hypothetical protein CVS35_12680 [Pectobacterium atrosepticum]KFX17921.1 hypothetical protein JV34_02575 [Pectobacterium atrosepticum]